MPSRFPHGPAEMLAVHRRTASATLFDGARRLLPDRETRNASFPGRPPPLPHEYRLPPPNRLLDRPEDVPVFGTSPALLLNTASTTTATSRALQIGTLDRLSPRE